MRRGRHAVAPQPVHQIVFDAAARHRTDRAAVVAQCQQRAGRAR
jgi:hypothetical protein